MVYTLLTEIIAFHVYILIIKLRIPGLKRPVTLVSFIFRDYKLVSSLFDVDFNQLLEEHISGS